MGRTRRKRRHRKVPPFQKQHTQSTAASDALKLWLLDQNWVPTLDLEPHIFPETGRGLMALKDIAVKDVLLELPKRLLITTLTVSESYISRIFLSDKIYDAQCVLATFLLYEKHLKEASNWKPYLDSLPVSYSNPEFCSKTEKTILPEFVTSQLSLLSRKCKVSYLSLMETLTILRSREFVCPHCTLSFDKIITFSDFTWGYYTVNTRAVYLDGTENIRINIKGDNLALAPFLDLFNHTCRTVAVAALIKKKESEFYQIKSLTSYKRGSQVFINYGAHNNLELYMEYGFVIPQNPLDEIKFDLSDIKKCINISRTVYNFLRVHNLDDNMSFSSQGLNYSAKNVLFICTTSVQKNQWMQKMFRDNLDSEDLSRVNSLGLKILQMKKSQLKQDLQKMKRCRYKSGSFLSAVQLLEEFIQVLESCLKIICE
ncbi:SET domain-containing protein 4 [Belonocnema kinseyi]|uniref:SET domain-containing protein 4 n=1 Tax=Belonocnema kinseyi TaxID=2817044 RepID=UPI00143DF5C1|nr:SET domain-containing protein 4 [Belonocnema kinseyi]XP_033227060.1 SET domain-containing protein 4 [Belonocnema kinseyi]XP_033227061.1 SET domain-containing protein 4 [Belonocnema kinseyi]